MDSTTAAIRTARALASALGLLGDAEPTVLADRSNLVLAIAPNVVARVAMAASTARVGLTWLDREVDLARWLDARGGLVTRPIARAAGPHERDGLVITFWERETLTADRADPTAAGAELARLHRQLGAYPRDRLPRWGGFEEARAIRERASARLTPAERDRLGASWTRAEAIVASAEARSASFQAVHGDAHIGNVLATTRGAVWTDWEDAFVGPIEFDLACLRSKADLFGEEREAITSMIDAYDAPYDRELASDLGLVRNVQVIVWLAIFAERQPELLPRMRSRLELLEPAQRQ